MSSNNEDRTFELYQEKSKNFNRTFGLLLGIGIFFFFFIFIPYISILNANLELSEDLSLINNLNNNFTIFQNDIDNFNTTLHNDDEIIIKFYNNTGLTLLDNIEKCNNNQYAQRLIQTTDTEFDEVKENVENERLWRLDVCYAIAKTMNKTKTPNNGTILSFYNNSYPADQYTAYATFIPKSYTLNYTSPILNKDEIILLEYFNASSFVGSPFWLYHNLKNKLESLFEDHFDFIKILRQNISKYNQTISSDLLLFNITSKERLNKIDQDLIKLKNDLPSLKKNFSDIIINAANLNKFNFNSSDQTLNASKFKDLLSTTIIEFSRYNILFNEINNTMESQFEHFNNITTSLNDKISQLEVKKNETSERLKEIEFPFGKIPISINESISFFPLGIGIGFLISASLLGDTIVIRKKYEDSLNGTKNNNKEIEQKVSIMAPLWIEPHSSLVYRIMKFLILLTPIVIFVISVDLILYYSKVINNEDNFSGIFIGNNKDNEKLYNILYIISLIFLLYGYWRIITELRKY
jgi:hypothetical protein